MDHASAIQTVNLVLSLTNKIVDKLPNYPQKKREQFHELLERYHAEKKAIYRFRDDQKIDDLREELLRFCHIFNKELAMLDDKK